MTLKLDMGCGSYKRGTDWIGLDKDRLPGVDIVRDLCRGLPFTDSTIDEIYCGDVLEHIKDWEDLRFVVNEMHRVLKPGCKAHVRVPTGETVWEDPSHYRKFVSETFDRFAGKMLPNAYTGIIYWKEVVVEKVTDDAGREFLEVNMIPNKDG